jgi:hypothetical protein
MPLTYAELIPRKRTPMPELIHDRKNTHGPVQEQFACAQELKSVCRANASERVLPVHQEAVEMIQLKVSRILAGDPDFPDHWEDIAGYAMRVVGK